MTQRTGGRAVEGARLESVYTFKAYRGFESPSVRQNYGSTPLTGDEWYSSVVVNPIFYNQTSIVHKVRFVVGDERYVKSNGM